MTNRRHVRYWTTQTTIRVIRLPIVPSFMNKIGNTIMLEPIIVFATLVITLNDESVP